MSDRIMLRTTETYTLPGDQRVSTAALLVGKLPNGWRLRSLTYDNDTWVAVVESGSVPL